MIEDEGLTKQWLIMTYMDSPHTKERNCTPFGVKAQFHIHLFKSEKINCLKLKPALNLTFV